MTKENLTLIAVVMDRSGSMHAVEEATRSGFNQFLSEQKRTKGECVMYYTQFDNEYEIVHRYVPIGEIPKLTVHNYQPRGETALLDAIGKTISQVGHDLDVKPEDERPSKVVFVVQTDGQENASKEYTSRSKIREMIETQQSQFNWSFVFLGASFDSIQEAASMGFAGGQSVQYAHNRAGTQSVFQSVSSNVTRYRSGASAMPDFSQEQRDEAKDGA